MPGQSITEIEQVQYAKEEATMKEINTIDDLVEFAQNDLAPRVDKSRFWSRTAAGDALVGGLATLGLFVLEFNKTLRG